MKQSLKDLENLSFMKEKQGINALSDSEVRDGSELQDLEKEHSAIMEKSDFGDEAVSFETIQIISNLHNCYILDEGRIWRT